MINDIKKFLTILEGGNAFKDENKEPVTQRIPREYIAPSLKMVEKILGIPLDNYLGTTGKKPTSGDIDVGVDATKYDRKEIANKLRAWAKSKGLKPSEWVKLSGTNVHFKLPIRNEKGEILYKNGEPQYAQLDLMFGNPEFMKWSMRGEPGKYKGVHRHIIMASIASAQGMKWSYRDGLIDRATGKVISQDPKVIASKLLPGSSVHTFDSVENILDFIYKKYKNNPEKIEQLLGQAYETLKDHYGVILPMPTDQQVNENDSDEYFLAKLRDRIMETGADIIMEAPTTGGRPTQHIEDLIIFEGMNGLRRALDILRSYANNTGHTKTSLKWDGCISGESVLITDKGKMPIKEVLLHDSISVLAHDFKTESDKFVPVLNGVRKNGNKEWVEIQLANGEVIQLTEDHEVYTTNRGWVQAKDLTIDDDIKESTLK